MKHNRIKIITIDFDGTLVESNKIKDWAFNRIFSEWPEYKNQMMDWHFEHNTIDRKEKFRFFVEDILFLSDKILIEKLNKQFSELTKQRIIECPYVKGAIDFLDYINNHSNIYLVSATPEKELNNIVESRDLKKYFKGIYGAPIDKVKVLDKIISNEKVSIDEILYIGDTHEDLVAAKILGINFIGRKSDRYLNNELNNVFLDFVKIKDYFLKEYILPSNQI